MTRRRKLTPDQHRIVAERSLLHFRLRLEAAKHSPYQLAKELGVGRSTVRDYINRRLFREV
jgi:hypothetical protein